MEIYRLSDDASEESRYLFRCTFFGALPAIPSIIITISPRGWFAEKYSTSSQSVPVCVESCIFDISRHTAARRVGPQVSASSFRVAHRRNGDSYITNVRGSTDNSSRRVRRPFLGGRNPSNVNLSHGRPEFTRAGISAVGRGESPHRCLPPGPLLQA